jgi:hypothetical protein
MGLIPFVSMALAIPIYQNTGVSEIDFQDGTHTIPLSRNLVTAGPHQALLLNGKDGNPEADALDWIKEQQLHFPPDQEGNSKTVLVLHEPTPSQKGIHLVSKSVEHPINHPGMEVITIHEVLKEPSEEVEVLKKEDDLIKREYCGGGVSGDGALMKREPCGSSSSVRVSSPVRKSGAALAKAGSSAQSFVGGSVDVAKKTVVGKEVFQFGKRFT